MKPYLFLIPHSLFLIFFALPAQAATLSLDPSSGTYGPGDTFIATVRLDLGLDECVNAATVKLSYPKDWMRVSTVSKGESILSLWPDEPRIDPEGGTVLFSGGIPGGYCGRIAGDPGKTNVIAKIIFTLPGNMIGGKIATGSEKMQVNFMPESSVLLNDGFGTKAPLNLTNAVYVRALESPAARNEWIDFVRQDEFPPEQFNVEVQRDSQTFQGKYFIVFSTVDKQSGVHHYEVSEDDPRRLGYKRGKNEVAHFVESKSPYVLLDQELKSRIIVRAFDHNGNHAEKIVSPSGASAEEMTPLPLGGNYPQGIVWGTGAAALLALLGCGGWWYKRKRKIVSSI